MIKVRWVIQRDLEQLEEIDQASGFATSFTQEDFARFIRTRNVIGLVADDYEIAAIAGYIIYEIHPRHLTILRLAVHPEWRREGVGRLMVATLANMLTAKRKRRLCMEICECELESHLFLRAMGLQATGIRPQDDREGHDHYVFEIGYADKKRVHA